MKSQQRQPDCQFVSSGDNRQYEAIFHEERKQLLNRAREVSHQIEERIRQVTRESSAIG